jgi:iron complex outermembrane receptor protein
MIVLFNTSLAFAEDRGYFLPPVKVTGARVNEESQVTAEKRTYDEPSYSRLALPESSVAETAFTAKDIEQMHPKTVFDVLDFAPNLIRSFSNSMNPNNFKSRGGDVIGLIVDGIYIPSTQSTRMLANFPVTIIESIRIVRDSTALTLGPLATISNSTTKPNAAVEGYIIITTKRPLKKEAAFRLSYDSAQSLRAGYSFGDVNKDWSYTFSFNHADTPSWGDHNDANRSDSLYFRGGYKEKSLLANVSLYVDWASWECPRLDNNGVLGQAKWKFDPSNTTMLNFDMAKMWDAKNTTTFSFGYSQVKSTLLEDYTDRKAAVLTHGKYAPMSWDLNENVKEYNIGHTFSYGKNTLKIGTQALHWDMQDMQGYQYRNKKEEGFGYYITDEYKVNKNLSFDAGARIDRRHTISQTDPRFNDTWSENNTSFALGAAYRLSPVYKMTSRFSYSTQPAYDWLLKNNNTKPFEPDTRRKYEVGLNANFSKWFNLDCTLFYYDISNYKYVARSVSNKTTGVTDYYYDSANIVQKGLEIGISGNLSKNLSYNASFAYLDVSDNSVSKTLPKNSATAMLNYKNKDYVYNLTAKQLGGYSQTATNGDGLGNYLRLDASISKLLKDKSKITIYGKNITNQHYAEAYQNGASSGMLGYMYNRGSVFGIEYSKRF